MAVAERYQLKRCSHCEIEKRAEEFPCCRISRDGLAFWCRECYMKVNQDKKDLTRLRRREHHERVQAAAKACPWRLGEAIIKLGYASTSATAVRDLEAALLMIEEEIVFRSGTSIRRIRDDRRKRQYREKKAKASPAAVNDDGGKG